MQSNKSKTQNGFLLLDMNVTTGVSCSLHTVAKLNLIYPGRAPKIENLDIEFFDPPDLSAGSFRTSALARAIHSLCPKATVTVITSIPHRYGSYNFDPPRDGKVENLSVIRLKTRSHNGSLIGQSLSFIDYAWKTNKLLKGSDYNLVYATSSRLMTGVLGAWISRRLKSKFYLDIRDIFLDSLPGSCH